MKNLVKFAVDVHEDGAVKFAAGQYYALDSRTQSLVDSGHASLIDATSSDDLEVLGAIARIAKDRSAAANKLLSQTMEEFDESLRLFKAAVADASASGNPNSDRWNQEIMSAESHRDDLNACLANLMSGEAQAA